ncbi:beta-ketoacyl-[acyl-carrier-protein] synthase family protein [Ruminiclostridium cellobioparum]|jgi:3-oxoacyl-[acyl-carrier-protein] synthase II|uniref:beta-ketoacyl-[acyl-carrier-protein] synthase family protein n=1 Tax=Ruminiclostridium cellobioparum TaxID=29355 RepID=UPI0028A5C3FA|nr:beta-ketoacyl-[acyl-carrier-protein] synthase family protein [Ruminiclostridium cellobioparum]
MNNCVITGMGVLSTAGLGSEEFWETLMNGKITYGEIENFKDNPNFRIKIGAKIMDESWSKDLTSEMLEKYGRTSCYAIRTAVSAIKDSGLSKSDISDARVAICIGTTMGEIQVEEKISEIRHEDGINAIPQSLLDSYRTDIIGQAVKEAIGASGPVYVVPAACAAGNYAIALGKRLLEWNIADVVIAGGVDVFSRVAFTGFQRLLSLTADQCRPFSSNRKGLVVGEGCGMFVMEAGRHAKARGTRVLGEILSVGLTSDRYHMTAPHPEGDGAARAMENAIRDAGISKRDIDYISAHGTGTPANDKVESKAVIKVFGQDYVPPVSSIKSMLGHAMGAASALELIASILMLERQIILPTVNFIEADPECPVDCVPNKPREAKLECILSNSFAFGGQDSSLIVRKGW